MRIGELAKRTGVSAHTIRYYEKEGLLDVRCLDRAHNNYRRYSEAAVQRLQLIRQGQSAGFTLSEIRPLLQLWESGDMSPAQQADLIKQKVEEIDTRLLELERIKTYLLAKMQRLSNEAQDAQSSSSISD